MNRLLSLVTIVALFLPTTMVAAEPTRDIQAVLTQQVDAWNRGDIPAFVSTYAEDCLFVGKTVTQGKNQLRERYEKTYPNRDAMGTLTFSELAIHLLDREVAVVTAKWHLERKAAGGGPTGGIFSLVLQRRKGQWKIAVDHTA